jgi:3-mercaptopyruvate sulfurtransferase SseA
MKKSSTILLSAIIPMILMAFVFSCQTPGEMKADQSPPQYAHPEAIASNDWLQTLLEDINIRIVDCSVSFINPNSYNVGHIPGAVSLEVIGQLSDPKGRVPLLILPENQFKTAMGKLGIGNETMVVVYDAFGGPWSL